MATQISQRMHAARKYYCSRPINNACRKGFTSVSGYNRHKRKIHSAPKHLIRPQRNPYIPEIHLNLSGNEDGLQNIFEALDAEAPVEGAYYLKHPVLDGKL